MKFSLTRLKNGLRVICVPLPNLASVTTSVWVRTGSRFEDRRVNGISHFLEHMVFKGGRKYKTSKEIFGKIDALGAQNNAATSKEWTNFYIKSRAGVLDTSFDILSDVVLYPALATDEIERERGVILEEIALYEDTPISKIGDIFENLIFPRQPLGWDIIGTPDNIKSIRRSDFSKYRTTHYYPHNMLITVAGGVTEKRVLDLSCKYFSSFESKKKLLVKPKQLYKQEKPKTLVKYKATDQAHLIIGFRGNPMGHQDRYAEAVLSVVLGGGASSRLFTEVRERRGLAYAVRTSVSHYLDTGHLATYAGVRLKAIDEAIKVIQNEYSKVKKPAEITNRELSKAKEYLKGHLALSLEDTRNINDFFGVEQLLIGENRSPAEVFAGIDKVSIEDVVRVAKVMFKRGKLNLAVIGPFKSQERFERLLK
ncbi:MAG: M16 family metallopeptidase [Patescibacteria group bacterium]